MNIKIAGILAAAIAFAGCSDDDAEGINFPSSSQKPSDSLKDDVYFYELAYNHMLLGVLYYDAHLKKELNDDVRVYYGLYNEEDYTKGACTAPFADVCGMYNQMSDKFTRYFDPTFADRIMKMLNESDELIGLGIDVDIVKSEEDSYLVIKEVYPNGPSDGRLDVNDIIVKVNEDIPRSIEGFEKLTTFDTPTVVNLTILRDGEEKVVSIKTGSFLSASVHLKYRDSIPVIKIDQFVPESSHEAGTYGEFFDILNKVVKSGAKSAVIDLRGNPGGGTDHCTNISSELLDKGDTIITFIETEVDSVKRMGQYEYVQRFDTLTYTATSDGIGRELYYVFLADEGSASCAELMLSAVAINKKTPIIGQTTYGKGIGQYYVPTYANGIAGITGIHGFDKDGVSYHTYGIEPDYKISDPEEQLEKAVELAKEAKETRTKGYGTVSTGNFDKKAAVIPTTQRDMMLDAGLYKIKRLKK